MKRWLWLMAIVTGCFVVALQGTSRGQNGARPPVGLGPGDGGATLKLPGMDAVDPKGVPRPAVPNSLKGLWNPAAAAFPKSAHAGVKIAEPPSNATDINKDIEIDAKAGNYVIFLMAYTGPKAPVMARKFVAVMRGHYKWNAYVFNYGAEEKRKEYERVQKIRQEQIDALKKAGLDNNLPIRVATMRINEQTAVLLGGYKTRDEASAALHRLKDHTKNDPKYLIGNVDLDTVFTAKLERTAPDKGPKVLGQEASYVNPFKNAFVTRNPHPGVPKENNGMSPEEELKFLRHINADEPLSVLKCKKPFTLVIKEYHMQFKTVGGYEEIQKANTFVKKLDDGIFNRMFNKGKIWEDRAAWNAHNLAEGLRKARLDAYVLHHRNCSFVTIGNYDSLRDPQLLAMQNVLEPMFKGNGYRELDLLPRAIPMLIPGMHVK